MKTKLEKAIIKNDVEGVIAILNGLKHSDDVKGTCLMHIKDKLASAVDTPALVERGIVFDYDQFAALSEQLQEAYKDNSRARTYLKRLFRGLEMLVQSWSSDTIFNEKIKGQNDSKAIQDLVDLLSQKYTIYTSLKTALSEKMDKAIKEFTDKWLSGTDEHLASDVITLVTTVLSLKLHESWRQGVFDTKACGPELIKILNAGLIDDLQRNQLPGDFSDKWVTAVTDKLVSRIVDVDDQFHSSKLGSYTIALPPQLIRDPRLDYANKFAQVLDKWRNKRVPNEVSQQIRQAFEDELPCVLEKIPADLLETAEVFALTHAVDSVRGDLLNQASWRSDFKELVISTFYELFKKEFTFNEFIRGDKEAIKAVVPALSELRVAMLNKVMQEFLTTWKLSPKTDDYTQDIDALTMVVHKAELDKLSHIVYPRPSDVQQVSVAEVNGQLRGMQELLVNVLPLLVSGSSDVSSDGVSKGSTERAVHAALTRMHGMFAISHASAVAVLSTERANATLDVGSAAMTVMNLEDKSSASACRPK